jgi:hypothetical protein
MEVVSLTLYPPPRKIPGYSFLLEAESTPEAISAAGRIRPIEKIAMTSSGIELA